MDKSAGTLLKKWRKQRRYSQLQLAVELDISSKHISFIETGRALPSKAMILKIGLFLSIPKREINRVLNSAGFAPAYTDLSINHETLKPVIEAIEQIIENHQPYPALVLNLDWDIVNANNAAKTLMKNLGFSMHTNLIEAIISDQPTQSHPSKIINWHEASSLVLMRLRAEISSFGEFNRLQELEQKLSDCLPPNQDIFNVEPSQTVLSTQFHVDNKELSFFSIIAQLGTVQDVTLSEFKVELMFPADDATKGFYKN